MKRITAIAVGLIVCATVTSVVAQPAGERPPPGCAAWNVNLPVQWAGWAESVTPLKAATAPADAGKAALAVGKRYSITLAPAKGVRMAVETSDAEAPPNAQKGILSLRIPADGDYWIGSTQGLWIDVVSQGTIVTSTDHGPGPNCASVRKSVQFPLKAGEAFIQLSDNNGPNADIIVVRQP